MMTVKIRMATKAYMDVCFLLPILSPIKEAMSLLFSELLFFYDFVLTVKCHSGYKFSLKKEPWVGTGF